MGTGVFAKLKHYGIEGLVRVRDMGDDYYVHDERTKSFRGRQSQQVYRIGDPIFVRVIRVDELKSEIDMAIISEAEFREEGGARRMAEEPIDAKFEGGADEGGGSGARAGTRSTRRKGSGKSSQSGKQASESQSKTRSGRRKQAEASGTTGSKRGGRSSRSSTKSKGGKTPTQSGEGRRSGRSST